MTPGRNDPCPCGSGRKYKHCCALKPVAGAGRYTKPERDRALAKLMEHAWREFPNEAEANATVFWGIGPPDGVSDSEYADVIASPPGREAFSTWFLYDSIVGPLGSPAEYFAARAPALSSGERAWLDIARVARLKVYEILDVKPEEGFTLRELLSGDELEVRERQGTRQLVKWELIAARVVEGPQGVSVLESVPYAFNPETKGRLLKLLKRVHRGAAAEHRRTGGFFRAAAIGLNQLWLAHVVFPPMPEIRTSDGDPVVLCRTVYDARDAAAVRAALIADGDFESDEASGSLTWLVPGKGENRERRILGSAEIRNGRLTLETMSRERAERGKALVERLAGGLVTFRAMRVQSMDQALRERRGLRDRDPGTPGTDGGGEGRLRAAPPRGQRARRGADEIPPEVQAEILQQFYEKHYREWLDQPIPALKNRTPRAAARLKSARPALIELLKSLQSRQDRERLDGRPAYDTAWLWDELGIGAEGV